MIGFYKKIESTKFKLEQNLNYNKIMTITESIFNTNFKKINQL